MVWEGSGRQLGRRLVFHHAAGAEDAGLHRAVADYIAGTTERFAVEEHRRLLG